MLSLPLSKDFTISHSRDLVLRHPTPDECVNIWTETSEPWGDALPLSVYLRESEFLTTIPLAKDENMTTWILVNKDAPADHRPLFCSCETYRKAALTSNSHGEVTEKVVHGIASVFCSPQYRRQGYASRMMKELTNILPTWRLPSGTQCVGTILYSDIGKLYYAKLGWNPNPTNMHIELLPQMSSPRTTPVLADDLEKLCQRDEATVRRVLEVPSEDIRKRVTILPNLEHMLWHIAKAEFATEYLFGTVPNAKGAIIGEPGSQIWAIWTHRYYNHYESVSAKNVLYILRLTIECDKTATRLPSDADKVHVAEYGTQLGYLKAILQAAQAEASFWKLDCVNLWDPTPLVQKMITDSGIDHVVVDREEDSIACATWYDDAGEVGEAPLWVNNEYYTWL
ncbi:hypothetical protein BDV96DRAFT_499435 [Lophiotrema nucula]|uniref:LYC1 C-terminal domain-containing protein n=1 Tax=Lophiotrema nucula TaxID=690887 RepID=A0A6A5YXE2_9PLEO|nr:hypothetical protein BDV96DRAFT_499435 [Lophiotrema nucula]